MKRLLPLLFLVSACQRQEEATPPTAAENAQLDDADAMLDRLANEEGAAPEDTTPSNRSN